MENGRLFMNGVFLAKIYLCTEISILMCYKEISIKSCGGLMRSQMVNCVLCSFCSFNSMRFDSGTKIDRSRVTKECYFTSDSHFWYESSNFSTLMNNDLAH